MTALQTVNLGLANDEAAAKADLHPDPAARRGEGMFAAASLSLHSTSVAHEANSPTCDVTAQVSRLNQGWHDTQYTPGARASNLLTVHLPYRSYSLKRRHKSASYLRQIPYERLIKPTQAEDC